ncbi:MAG: hydroxylamine oxidoreductase, partial [Planctomycetota bacterium]
MNKLYFNAKQFFFIILPVFVILTISIRSFAYEYGSVIPQVNETPFARTTATPHGIPGNMRFR